MLVTSANAFIFDAVLVVGVAAHEVHGGAGQLLVAMAAVADVEVLRRPLHASDGVAHLFDFLDGVVRFLPQELCLLGLVPKFLEQERL